MSKSLLDQWTSTDQFEGGEFEDSNLIKKTLTDGDNTFRLIGKGKTFYVHRFDAACGTRVMSICVKDVDGNGECEVCKMYKDAWKILNDAEKAMKEGDDNPFPADVYRKAQIEAGQINHPKINFKQSVGAKKHIAYNCLDRDSNINEKENHLSLLCKSKYDKGLSSGQKGIYEQVVKLLTRHRKQLEEHINNGHDYVPFDITLIRTGKGQTTDYDKEKGDDSPLTEEELNFERYNLDEIIKVTDAAIVHGWITVGTKKSKNKKEDDSEDVSENADEVPTTVEKSKPAKKETEPDGEVAAPTKSRFKPKTEPKKEPAKKETEVEMDKCYKCQKMIPITSTKCPNCGEEFGEYEEEATTEPATKKDETPEKTKKDKKNGGFPY